MGLFKKKKGNKFSFHPKINERTAVATVGSTVRRLGYHGMILSTNTWEIFRVKES